MYSMIEALRPRSSVTEPPLSRGPASMSPVISALPVGARQRTPNSRIRAARCSRPTSARSHHADDDPRVSPISPDGERSQCSGDGCVDRCQGLHACALRVIAFGIATKREGNRRPRQFWTMFGLVAGDHRHLGSGSRPSSVGSPRRLTTGPSEVQRASRGHSSTRLLPGRATGRDLWAAETSTAARRPRPRGACRARR